MWYSVVYISLEINTLLCYGIARGQYYWILGALFGIVLTLVTQKYIFNVHLHVHVTPSVRC